jgi:5-methyltetrahydrofolate--homocysteine methyltransferase
MDFSKITLFDSAMGTSLIAAGALPAGESSWRANIDAPEVLFDIHRRNIEAGSEIITANTFSIHIGDGKGGDDTDMEEALREGVRIAKKAASTVDGNGTDGHRVLTALDIGPIGDIIGITSSLTHEDATEIFARSMRIGAEEGADLVLIETMSDLAEALDAIAAAKAETDLPIICSMTFGESGRTFMGVSPEEFVPAAAEAGAGVVGANCSLGPDGMLPIAEALVRAAGGDVPVIVQPNAGLPKMRGAEVYYDMTPEIFVDGVCAMIEAGARFVGGCCGTTPEMIALLNEKIEDKG